jgi:GABA permease
MTKILVVATSGIEPEAAGREIGKRYGEDAEIRVVAPVSGLGRLDWLTNAEDDARRDSERRANDVADAVPGDPVETEVGDVDPVQAIEDDLRLFDADEIVIVTREDEDVTWLEDGATETARERFSVPVTHVVVSD